jgi:uncharacterized iron-regulated protein
MTGLATCVTPFVPATCSNIAPRRIDMGRSRADSAAMRTHFLTYLFVSAAAAVLAGCSSGRYFDAAGSVRCPDSPPGPISAEEPRSLPVFCGFDGTPLCWEDVLKAAAWADVIIIGEQHDDAVGHAVQRAVVEDVMGRWNRCALSLEMLERDEQLLVEDYLDGFIDAEAFADLTHSQSWAGEGSWKEWYQPIIDAAKDAGGRVVAANAPRRYVKLARTGGYRAISALPADRRRFVDRPQGSDKSSWKGYRDRFFNLMSEMHETPAPEEGAPEEDAAEGGMPSPPSAEDEAATARPPLMPPRSADAKAPEAEDAGAAGAEGGSPPAAEDEEAQAMPPMMPPPGMPGAEEAGAPAPEGEAPEGPPQMPVMSGTDFIESLFRSQLVWDTTMAKSIAKARQHGARKVIHLVGQFHSDFEGGTVQQLRRFRPFDRILVISMQRAEPMELREEDRGRADIVIYTGERPPEEEPAEAEAAEDEPAAMPETEAEETPEENPDID